MIYNFKLDAMPILKLSKSKFLVSCNVMNENIILQKKPSIIYGHKQIC